MDTHQSSNDLSDAPTFNWSDVQLAGLRGNLQVLHSFLEHPERVRAATERDDDFLPLHIVTHKIMELYVWCAEHRQQDAAQLLLDKAPDNTPFHKSLYRMRRTVEPLFISKVLEQKMVTTDQLQQAFWHACSDGSIEQVDLYLKHGVDPNAQDARAFRHAIRHSSKMAMRLAACTDVESHRKDMLKTLVKVGNLPQALIDQLYDFEIFEAILTKMKISNNLKYPKDLYLNTLHQAHRERHDIEGHVDGQDKQVRARKL